MPKAFSVVKSANDARKARIGADKVMTDLGW